MNACLFSTSPDAETGMFIVDSGLCSRKMIESQGELLLSILFGDIRWTVRLHQRL